MSGALLMRNDEAGTKPSLGSSSCFDETRAHTPLPQVMTFLAQAKPSCTVYACSTTQHTLQIYAGLYALHAAGRIRLKQRFGVDTLKSRLAWLAPGDPVFSPMVNALFLDIEDVGLVCVDVRDGANYYGQVVDRVSLYAKRSFRPAEYGAQRGKFVPLGLNYAAFLDRTTWHELVRTLAQLDLSSRAAKRLVIVLARLFPMVGDALDVPTVRSLSCAPIPELAPKALFLARTWAPGEDHLRDDDVRDINDFRAQCIRVLRRSLGSRFLGGFARTAYACKAYPDCVVDGNVNTQRAQYLKRLRRYPVCVATTGLWESIGWKFGEYIAFSRAIAAERLRFELPGPIAPGKNYLEFDTVDGCVETVGRLLDDDTLRRQMMENNWRYYVEYGSPDAVVARVLHAALTRRGRMELAQ